MKRMISTMGACALLAWFAAPTVASAEEAMGNVNNGRLIFQNGKGDADPACQGCHGIDGNGSDEMGTPRLAYQVDTYILKQLTDFAETSV
ncbi:c-type cytochrome, partial [Mariprofundus ferrooxydans]